MTSAFDNIGQPLRKKQDVTSNYLFSPDGPMLEHVMDIMPDGEGVSAELKEEIHSIAEIGFNDTIFEYAHSLAKRAKETGCVLLCASWSWVCPTLRHEQCLTGMDDLLKWTKSDVQREGNR